MNLTALVYIWKENYSTDTPFTVFNVRSAKVTAKSAML